MAATCCCGARSNYSLKRELVILIKPTIIRNESSWKDDLLETQSRIQQYDPRLARPQSGAQRDSARRALYLKHFGLNELPFRITPDTSFAYANQHQHQEALNILLLALNDGEGFVKISGEVGTGKTLLCRRLLQSLGDDWVTAYLPNPNLDPDTPFPGDRRRARHQGRRRARPVPPVRRNQPRFARLGPEQEAGGRVYR